MLKLVGTMADVSRMTTVDSEGDEAPDDKASLLREVVGEGCKSSGAQTRKVKIWVLVRVPLATLYIVVSSSTLVAKVRTSVVMRMTFAVEYFEASGSSLVVGGTKVAVGLVLSDSRLVTRGGPTATESS